MSEHLNNNQRRELQTKLVGEPQVVTVNPYLKYRVDQVEFPNGKRGPYTYIDDDYAAAATVPMANINGKRSVFLICQERYPSQTIGWEIPAGGPNEGETQLDAARRELEEEAGLVAKYWEQLPQQVENVGRGNSRSDIFIAAGIAVVKSMAEAEEVITGKGWFTMDQVEDFMLNGEMSAGHSMAAIAVANAFVNRNPEHPISQIVGQRVSI